MRHVPNLRIEQYRTVHPALGWSEPGENWGYFEIPRPTGMLRVVACDGTDPEAAGWEHVSVSLNGRCPKWEEMAFVKNLFWPDDETVVQFHPKKSAYINCHPHVLHLWRRIGEDIELPPGILIGPKEQDAACKT
jgi:hypothetical protein